MAYEPAKRNQKDCPNGQPFLLRTQIKNGLAKRQAVLIFSLPCD